MQNDLDPKGLRPCPFCGEMPEVRGSVIGCKNIKCWGPSIWHMVNPEDSAAAWNRRHLSAVPDGDGELVEPCGGCGQADPRKRCIGCHHDFKAASRLSQAGVRVTDEMVERAMAAHDGRLADGKSTSLSYTDNHRMRRALEAALSGDTL